MEKAAYIAIHNSKNYRGIRQSGPVINNKEQYSRYQLGEQESGFKKIKLIKTIIKLVVGYNN